MGHRVELEEIEKSINKIFKLKDCLVILMEKKIFPFQSLSLITDNKKINEQILEKKLRKKLPKYMIPHNSIYVKKFKLNNNGKLDRKYYKNLKFNV